MKTSEMEVLVLEGEPHQKGLVHGEALKARIYEQVARLKIAIGKWVKMAPDAFIDQFIQETNFQKAIQRWTPDLWEELEGIAEGSGNRFKDIYVLNLADELWWYAAEKNAEFESPGFGAENCSSLGVEPKNGLPALVAQNLDLPAYYDGLQVLLHIKDHRTSIESYVFSFAGDIGAVGLNNRSVGMCENTLLQLKHAADGLPVLFVSRGILSQPTLEDAVAFVHRIKHASGQNYVLGSPDGVVNYECSANKVSRFVPFVGAHYVYHTNHTLVNDDKYEYNKSLANSETRLNSLKNRLKDTSDPITVDLIKSILSSHDSEDYAICVHPSPEKQGITANCLIMELSSEPKVHFTAGPPCECEFRTLSF
ncbi:MAG: C45 family peptidase [Anaerolineaceae bacterium]|nr:C45 family peptidase [Anaerolineaceae bacterium]